MARYKVTREADVLLETDDLNDAWSLYTQEMDSNNRMGRTENPQLGINLYDDDYGGSIELTWT